MSKAKVIPLGVENKSAIQQAAEIEECLNNFGAIIPVLDECVEGECYTARRAWLVTELDRNFRLLDGLLAMRSTTVAG